MKMDSLVPARPLLTCAMVKHPMSVLVMLPSMPLIREEHGPFQVGFYGNVGRFCCLCPGPSGSELTDAIGAAKPRGNSIII